MMHDRPDHAPAVHAALAAMGAERFVRELGVRNVVRQNRRAVRVPCPVHGGKDPNCDVAERDGRIVFACFSGCGGEGGDALAFVAAVRGLDVRRDFRAVLAEGARLAGLHSLADELEGRGGPHDRRSAPGPNVGTGGARRLNVQAPERPDAQASERPYPPEGEVLALWAACVPVPDSPEASAYLEARALDPLEVEARDLARALPVAGELPRWARYQGRTWRETAHTIVLPVFDSLGRMRSVRAMRVRENDTPKRLPPTGFRAGGLVLADATARELLARGAPPDWYAEGEPMRVAIAEGEPDFLTWATRTRDADPTPPAVFGIGSGAWSPEVAGRVPDAARVTIRTHADDAGEKYARHVADTLARRCTLLRLKGTPREAT